MVPLVLEVGTIRIIPLTDGAAAQPAAALMPSVPAEAWEPLRAFLDPGDAVPLNFGAFLIGERGAWTLVDTGVGGRPGSHGGTLLAGLESAGVRPDDVSTVLFTHLHPDHVGWSTVDRDGEAAVLFARARHLVQRRDWEYFAELASTGRYPVFELCVAPVARAGLLDLIDEEMTLSAGVSTLFTPGHTPGHQSVLVASDRQRALIAGDVTHMPAQVAHPEWSLAVDTDPELGARTRAELWERVEREQMTVLAGHYRYPSAGRVVTVGGQRRWEWL